MQIQSDGKVLENFFVEYSLQALHTLNLQERQGAPRFMMRPNSIQQRAHVLYISFGSESVDLRFDDTFCNPRRLRLCNSALIILL